MNEPGAQLRAVGGASNPAESAPAVSGITPPRRRGGSGRFLTDVLVELGLCDAERVRRAIEESRVAGVPPERLLLDQRAITTDQLSRAIAERYGLDHLDLGTLKVDMGAANLMSASSAKRYGAVPVAYLDERTLLVAMSDPANVLAADDIALLTRMDIRPAVASAEDVSGLIARMNRFEDAVQEAVGDKVTGRSRTSSATDWIVGSLPTMLSMPLAYPSTLDRGAHGNENPGRGVLRGG